jgi:hypothetical protein
VERAEATAATRLRVALRDAARLDEAALARDGIPAVRVKPSSSTSWSGSPPPIPGRTRARLAAGENESARKRVPYLGLRPNPLKGCDTPLRIRSIGFGMQRSPWNA